LLEQGVDETPQATPAGVGHIVKKISSPVTVRTMKNIYFIFSVFAFKKKLCSLTKIIS
jgi:hypothetical protein